MTKQEIYDKVVELTDALQETGLVTELFDVIHYEGFKEVDKILDVFHHYYPDLSEAIEHFGRNFNKMIGESKEDEEDLKMLLDQGELLYNLAESGIIREIANADSLGDNQKVLELIKKFHQEHGEGLEWNLRMYQLHFDEFRSREITGHEGEIFGPETDVEAGIHLYDPDEIDALSLFLLSILAHIRVTNFFSYDECEEFECEEFSTYSNLSEEIFINAIREATTRSFAEFVESYSPFDWIGDGQDEYSSIGEVLDAAFNGEFKG